MTNDPNLSHRTIAALRFADRCIEQAEHWLLACGIMAMAALGIANVVARNVFDASLSFATEANELLIILITFAGIGYAARLGRHIRMTAVYDQLHRRGRKVLMITMAATTAALLFYLSFHAVRYVLQTASAGSVTPALRIPLYVTYVAVPAGLLLGGIQFTLTAARNVLSRDVYISLSRRDLLESTPDTRDQVS